MDNQRKDDIVLEQHIVEEMERYSAIIERLDRIESQMEVIIDIWTQTKGVVNFVKVLSYIGAAVGGVYVFVTSNFSILPK